MLFEGGMEGRENGTVILACAAALIYAVLLHLPPSLARSAVKTLAVALLAVLAILTGGPAMLVLALALSAVGDWFLSRDGETAFLAGLASFLAAHVAYVALFVAKGEGFGLISGETWRIGLAILMALLALVMWRLLMQRVGPALRSPVTAYVVAILAMGVTSLTVPNGWVVAGAVMFMASDTLLATERFVLPAISPHRIWIRYGVWGLYFAAQFVITMAFVT